MDRLVTNCIFLMQLMTRIKNGRYLRLKDKAQAHWMSTQLKYAMMVRCLFLEDIISLVTYRTVSTFLIQQVMIGRLNFQTLLNNYQVHEPAILASS